MRKKMFGQMEAGLQKTCKPEDRMFALHPDEEHIVVSHALFLMMSKPLASKLPSLKSERFLLVAQIRGRDADGLPDRI